MKKFNLLFCCFIICSCLFELQASTEEKMGLYAWIDKVKVRESPNFNTKTTGVLRIGDRVIFQGEMSKTKYQVQLRKTSFNTPFYLVKYVADQNSYSGWVYGGALKELSDEIMQYDRLLEEVGQISKLLRKSKKNSTHTRISPLKSSRTKRKVIYEYYVGTNGCTGDEFNSYMEGGIIYTGEFFQQAYYFAPYDGKRAGISLNMSKNEVLKTLGEPFKQVPNAVQYIIDEERDATLTFYFKDNKVFAIVSAVFESC